MSWADTEAFLGSLQILGITPTSGNVALIRQDKGLLHPCDWLELGHFEGELIAKLSGSQLSALAAPPGWTPGEKMVLTTEQTLRENYDYIGGKDSVESFQDRTTGEILHVGRARPSKARRRWWRLWK